MGRDTGHGMTLGIVPVGVPGCEWQSEHRGESYVLAAVEPADTDCDGLLGHVQFERAVKAIPDRQAAGPVRVHFIDRAGMMDAVHAGRDDDSADPAFESYGNLHIRMMKQDTDEEESCQTDNAAGLTPMSAT